MNEVKGHGPRFSNHEEFIQFVRTVSPRADINSVKLFGQLRRCHSLMEKIMERRLEAVGLSWSQLRLLMNLLHSEKLGQPGGLQPSELSERQDISRNTVSALISSLEKDGLVSRQLHGEDRRKFLIHLTPAGRKLLLEQMDDQFNYITQIFQTLAAPERQRLLDLLLGLGDSLKAQLKQGKTQAHAQQQS
jgi:DNA-binding MarR family transcriptional regulator